MSTKMRLVFISTLLLVLATFASEANGRLISENDELVLVQPQDVFDKPELIANEKQKSSEKSKDCNGHHDGDDDHDDDRDLHDHKDCDNDDDDDDHDDADTSEAPHAEKDDDLEVGVIVGIVAACLVAVIVVIISLVLCCKKSSPKAATAPVMKTVYAADPPQINQATLPGNYNDNPPPYSPESMSNEKQPPPYASI